MAVDLMISNCGSRVGSDNATWDCCQQECWKRVLVATAKIQSGAKVAECEHASSRVMDWICWKLGLQMCGFHSGGCLLRHRRRSSVICWSEGKAARKRMRPAQVGNLKSMICSDCSTLWPKYDTSNISATHTVWCTIPL